MPEQLTHAQQVNCKAVSKQLYEYIFNLKAKVTLWGLLKTTNFVKKPPGGYFETWPGSSSFLSN